MTDNSVWWGVSYWVIDYGIFGLIGRKNILKNWKINFVPIHEMKADGQIKVKVRRFPS